METIDYQSVPQHAHNGHTAVPAVEPTAEDGHVAHVESIHYCCTDCGTCWVDTDPLCAHCRTAVWDVWYPTRIPDGDTDNAHRLRLCTSCALGMARRLIELAGEVIEDRTTGTRVPAGTPTLANRAQRRHAARQHSMTAITRRERGRSHA